MNALAILIITAIAEFAALALAGLALWVWIVIGFGGV